MPTFYVSDLLRKLQCQVSYDNFYVEIFADADLTVFDKLVRDSVFSKASVETFVRPILKLYHYHMIFYCCWLYKDR